MHDSIRVATEIAGFIAQQVKGRVILIFFNEEPAIFDVTGKTLEQIKE